MNRFPRFMLRRAILMAFGPMAVFVIWGVVCSLFVPRRVPQMFVMAGAVWFIWSVTAAVWEARRRRRLRGLLAAADGLMCFRCGYDLRGIGPIGACPECGEAFTDTALRRRWVEFGFLP